MARSKRSEPPAALSDAPSPASVCVHGLPRPAKPIRGLDGLRYCFHLSRDPDPDEVCETAAVWLLRWMTALGWHVPRLHDDPRPAGLSPRRQPDDPERHGPAAPPPVQLHGIALLRRVLDRADADQDALCDAALDKVRALIEAPAQSSRPYHPPAVADIRRAMV